MIPFVWKDRLVHIDDGTLMFSRAHAHSDFEFFPRKMDDDMAWAGRIGPGQVHSAFVGEDGSLMIEATGGTYRMPSDRVMQDGFLVEFVSDKWRPTGGE